MLKRGVYAASLSVLNKDLTLNVEATLSHGENLIKNGCMGVFFMGSTGQAQLCSLESKKELISKIASHKLRKKFLKLGVKMIGSETIFFSNDTKKGSMLKVWNLNNSFRYKRTFKKL